MSRTTLLAVAVLAACGAHDIVVGDLATVADIPARPTRDIDLLFVVDNSPSMATKQRALAANFPLMVDALSATPGGLPDVHIGVVTSDMGATSANDAAPGPDVGGAGTPGGCFGSGDNGALQVGSAQLVGGPFISDVDDGAGSGGRVRNYSGDLGDVFAQMAAVGENGCGFEQHLRAMQAGLANPANAGFLRDDADLAVVIVADEDDCSVGSNDATFFADDPITDAQLGRLDSYRCTQLGVVCDPDDPTHAHDHEQNCRPRADSPYIEDVQPFVDSLVSLKGDPAQVMVATIVAPATPFGVDLESASDPTLIPTLEHSCTFDTPDGPAWADPAVRLAAFANSFPGRATATSICSDDLSGALSDIGGVAADLVVGDPCLTTTVALADTSSAPGLQPACVASDVHALNPPVATDLPSCDSDAATDCFAIVADPTACPGNPDHLRVQVRRSRPASDDTFTHVQCQLAH
jgi:hypothetical protein|nr:hypothetical protein [Kofleriaceae bacterium]